MEGYKVEIAHSTKELTVREKIRIKDLSNAIQLDDVTQKEGNVVIDFDYYVILKVHNEFSKDDKDYNKFVIVDKGGNKFVTGSESFMTSLEGIVDEMADAGETDFEIEVYRKDSKNYTGKQFLTCTIV
nr:MAG TPA: ssDNA binding protein [Caudoviricetes sp.]